jgi:hypothetical protein
VRMLAGAAESNVKKFRDLVGLNAPAQSAASFEKGGY